MPDDLTHTVRVLHDTTAAPAEADEDLRRMSLVVWMFAALVTVPVVAIVAWAVS